MGLITCVGIDLGQKHDSTAIVVSQPYIPDGQKWAHYTIREMGRLPLGTPYPSVYKAIGEVLDGLIELNIRMPTLVVDATGATAAVDGLRDEVGRKCFLVAATFTHGDRLVLDPYGRGTASVGKAYLVNRLQVLIQSSRLHIPAMKPEAAAMMTELQNYEIRIDEDSNDRYGAFKVGTHDDLVTGLGLSVLEIPRYFPRPRTPPVSQQSFG
jgi:hypothetical protein